MARLPNFLVIIRSEKLSGKGQGRGVGVRKKERFVLGKRTFRSQKSKHFVLRIINWYISYGPSPLTKGEIPFMESNLLANILDTADTCIVKKENSATLRFGHESCLLPLACLLELGDCAYQTTDLSTLDVTWRNYKIFPMAGNIQFVFFRKKGNDDILVKVLLNEHEMKLPVESKLAPYYRWKDVETYYRNKLAAYKK